MYFFKLMLHGINAIVALLWRKLEPVIVQQDYHCLENYPFATGNSFLIYFKSHYQACKIDNYRNIFFTAFTFVNQKCVYLGEKVHADDKKAHGNRVLGFINLSLVPSSKNREILTRSKEQTYILFPLVRSPLILASSSSAASGDCNKPCIGQIHTSLILQKLNRKTKEKTIKK